MGEFRPSSQRGTGDEETIAIGSGVWGGDLHARLSGEQEGRATEAQPAYGGHDPGDTADWRDEARAAQGRAKQR